jgi:hypothetical protein
MNWSVHFRDAGVLAGMIPAGWIERLLFLVFVVMPAVVLCTVFTLVKSRNFVVRICACIAGACAIGLGADYGKWSCDPAAEPILFLLTAAVMSVIYGVVIYLVWRFLQRKS